MQVIRKLEGEPDLMVEKERYAVGDILRANCTSPAHNPPANMSITLNGQKVQPTFERRWAESDGRWVTVIGLESKVTRAGKVRLACVADLFGVFRAQSELTLDEDRPRLASVLGTRQSSPNQVGAGSSSGSSSSRNFVAVLLWNGFISSWYLFQLSR
ncbi:uncharacterized protein LOC120356105 [Nilaparvata lugens]|uniref:uncharacterized protein LOC120356105 n=1 Tax=Nilaparvata lugens TaxID=108931 RepID=UPI00193CF69A|nr:uncharacterized protein LOC120356105 [Nilaparvata lugens]